MGQAVRGGNVTGYRQVAAYTGPGDIVSGAANWWGLRAYSNASIGMNIVRLRESGGNTEQDFAAISGGGLDLAAITTFKGANNLFIVKLYDQSGSGDNMGMVTAANQPAFILSGLGSLPILRTTEASSQNLITVLGGVTPVSQPYTIAAVAKDPGASALLTLLGSTSSSHAYFFYWQNLYVAVDAGTLGYEPLPVNTWRSVQALANDTASSLYFDGTLVSPKSFGTLAFGTTNLIGLSNFGTYSTMDWVEAGIWSGAFSGANQADIEANAESYWGY